MISRNIIRLNTISSDHIDINNFWMHTAYTPIDGILHAQAISKIDQ